MLLFTAINSIYTYTFYCQKKTLRLKRNADKPNWFHITVYLLSTLSLRFISNVELLSEVTTLFLFHACGIFTKIIEHRKGFEEGPRLTYDQAWMCHLAKKKFVSFTSATEVSGWIRNSLDFFIFGFKIYLSIKVCVRPKNHFNYTG